MIDKDPTTYSIITYAWVVMLSAWGGMVSFIRKVKRGETKASNIMEFIGEIVTSAFVGVATFYLCEYAQIDRLMTAVLVAITGHMGARAIFLAEFYLERYIKSKTNQMR